MPNFGHDHTAGYVLAFDRVVFVVAAPDGGDQVRRETYKPDVFAFIGGAGLTGYRPVRQFGLGAGCLLYTSPSPRD